MKTIGRRLFARAAVGVPTALKFSSNPGLPPPPAMALNAASAIGMTAAQSAKQSLVEKIYQACWKGTQDHQQTESVRSVRRSMMGGLDPDLAVLNSMSLSRRVALQIDREIQARERERSIRHRIITSLGGNPDEFQ
jgi:hypothetical protein